MGNSQNKSDIENQNHVNKSFEAGEKITILRDVDPKKFKGSKRKGLEILQEIDNQYNSLNRRFTLRKKTYLMSCAYYHRLNLFVFIIPLMLIQVFVASSPLYLKDTETSKIHSVVSSAVAAVSALWIGLQTKLKWAEYSEKYQSAGHLYTYLLDMTWYKRKIFHIDVERIPKEMADEKTDADEKDDESLAVDEKDKNTNPVVQFLCSEEDCKRHYLELQKFMQDIEKLEKNTMDNTPLAPLWIAWHMNDFMEKGRGESSFSDNVQQ